jgi:hypothetical protein
MPFPFFCGSHPMNHREYKRFKLNQLKAIRDFLEVRLAATNAEIETVERQIATTDGAQAS